MSLVTRCPACSTCFRVVPDQLRISDGWVRCGQCSEVFDASQQMLEPIITSAEPVKIPLPEPEPAEQEQPPAQPEMPSEVQTEPEPDPEQAIESDAKVVADAVIEAEPAPESVPEATLAVKTPPTPAHQDATDWTDLPLSDGPISPETLSFLNPAARKQNPLWRGLLILLTLLFVLALPLQYVYHERDRLATLHTPLKPLLQTLCQPLGCGVSALRGIESMVLDSATFTKLGKDAFRLNFVVKNSAALDLAMPEIELTLTNLADQAIVRRVLTHSELGATTDTLQAGAEWHVSTVVQVTSEPLLPAVSGYRLLAFYP